MPNEPLKKKNFSSVAKPAGNLNDPGLSHLREEIKNVMLPLLIRVFELKQAASQAHLPSSRLNRQPTESPEKIQATLFSISKDLELLSLWIESAQNQVRKAVSETLNKTGSEHKTGVCASTDSASNPAIGAVYAKRPKPPKIASIKNRASALSWLKKLINVQ